MKDNLQNIADLIGALAEDIEAIKEKLDAKDSPDKSEALKRLEAKLEPVIQFFNGNAPENVNVIFGSKEAIEEYKQSIGDEGGSESALISKCQRQGNAQKRCSHYQGTAQHDSGNAYKSH